MENPEEIDLRPLVMRRLVWDLLPHEEVPDLLEEFGLLRGDEEMIAMEHTAADRRINLGHPYFNLILSYSALASSVLATTLMGNAPETAEDREKFARQNILLINSACCAIVANFLAAGILQPGPSTTAGDLV